MTKIVIEDPLKLAEAKLQGRLRDAAERKLVPEFSKIIYLVMGYTGRLEHGTFRSWPVRALRDGKTAQEYAKECQKHAVEWERLRNSYKDSPPYGWSMLDPGMVMSHEGTYYRVLEIPIAMRPEELDSPEDTCSICGAQVDHGICERGHLV